MDKLTKLILIQTKGEIRLLRGFEERARVWQARDAAPDVPLTEANIAWAFDAWVDLKAGLPPEVA
jgi:hypothetical protein